MTALKLLFLFVVLTVSIQRSAANGGPRLCRQRPNEVYLNPGPNCDRYCRNLNEPCTKVYVRAPSGCYCRRGYARDYTGACISIRFCGGFF